MGDHTTRISPLDLPVAPHDQSGEPMELRGRLLHPLTSDTENPAHLDGIVLKIILWTNYF